MNEQPIVEPRPPGVISQVVAWMMLLFLSAMLLGVAIWAMTEAPVMLALLAAVGFFIYVCVHERHP